MMSHAPVDIRGPRAPLPMLNVLRFFADPVGVMMRLAHDHGPVATVVDRRATLICAFGAALNQEVMAQPAVYEHLAELPLKWPRGSSLARLNEILVFTNGEQHRRRRRLMMGAFQKSAIDGYAPGVVATAERLLSSWPLGTPLDAAAKVSELTAAVTARALFGLDADDEREPLAHLEAEMLEAASSPVSMALQFNVPGLPFHRALKLATRVEARIREIIRRRREQGPGGGEMLSRLIFAQDDAGAMLSTDELVGDCNGLFVAGYHTTAQTVSWTLFLLTQHPAVLAALQDELSALGGSPPAPADLKRLPLLDRVVNESMRLLPAAPMLFLRVPNQSAKLGSYTVPAGSTVVLSPFVTHRAPDRFPEPSRFLPSRWESLQPTAYEYLPFGVGARMCLGAALGNLVVRTLLTMILQRFRLEPVENARISRTMYAMAMAPKHGLPMVLKPQDGGLPRPAVRVQGDIHQIVDLPNA